jgi:regulator of RNase E activity RraA
MDDPSTGSGQALVSRLLRLDTCAVADALDRLGLTGVVLGIAPMSPPAKAGGRVVTMKLVDRTPANLPAGQAGAQTTRHLGTAAIEGAGAGDVIVIEHARLDAAGWGGILSAAAKHKGLAGVVCEGAVRDIDEARDLGFPVFARAAVPLTARGRVVEESFNQPIRVGGVDVAPGDLVLADGSGVAFIAAAKAREVIEAAEAIAAREARMKDAVLAGDRVSEVMGRDYETMLQR